MTLDRLQPALLDATSPEAGDAARTRSDPRDALPAAAAAAFGDDACEERRR
jgi:hypothetical protein